LKTRLDQWRSQLALKKEKEKEKSLYAKEAKGVKNMKMKALNK